MKKVLTILGAFVLLFGITAGAQAAAPVAMTFDDITRLEQPCLLPLREVQAIRLPRT